MTDTTPLPARFAVLDIETTGLTSTAVPVEIAVVFLTADGLDIDEIVSFVPHVPAEQLRDASPEALQINRFYERGLFKQTQTVRDSSTQAQSLYKVLDDVTLVGANPAFDRDHLWRWIRRAWDPKPIFGQAQRPPTAPSWAFRMYDVETATMAVLDLDHLPSLAECADLWRVPVADDTRHTALGDALVTVEVFQAIRRFGKPAATTTTVQACGHREPVRYIVEDVDDVDDDHIDPRGVRA